MEHTSEASARGRPVEAWHRAPCDSTSAYALGEPIKPAGMIPSTWITRLRRIGRHRTWITSSNHFPQNHGEMIPGACDRTRSGCGKLIAIISLRFMVGFVLFGLAWLFKTTAVGERGARVSNAVLLRAVQRKTSRVRIQRRYPPTRRNREGGRESRKRYTRAR